MIIPGSVDSLRYISVSLALEAAGRFKDRKRHTRPFESYNNLDTSFVSLSVLVIFDYIGFYALFSLMIHLDFPRFWRPGYRK